MADSSMGPCTRILDLAFVVAAAIWACVASGNAGADDWTFFRGPGNDGVSRERGWSANWPAGGPRIPWRANVGVGVSSVVVQGNRLVTMGSIKDRDEDVVRCLDTETGSVVWKFAYSSKFDARQFEGGTASTPTIAGSRVFTLGYLGQVHCLDAASGRLLWKKHLIDDFGGRFSSWKYAGSPLVSNGLVIIDTGADGNSTVAMEQATGRKIWGAGDDLAGYATPIPFHWKGENAVLVFKARAMVALALDSGRELWRIDWRTYYDCNASTPTVVDDQLFISSGYGGRSARGAVFHIGTNEPQEVWLNQELETKMNSAVVYNGHVYCVSEKSGGQLMCFDLHHGDLRWSEPSFAKYGTLMIADNKLIVLDEEGDLVIASADPGGYHELARAGIHDERCWVMPVLANGRIFARSNLGKLACVDVRPKSDR